MGIVVTLIHPPGQCLAGGEFAPGLIRWYYGINDQAKKLHTKFTGHISVRLNTHSTLFPNQMNKNQ